MAYNFTAIEKRWQQYWLENKTFAALEPVDAGDMPKAFILDMFPYPSGAGLHVGHPEGYTATDIVSRYLRAKGYNVLPPHGLGRLRPARGAVRHQEQCPPRRDHAEEHRHLPPADPVAGPELRLGPRGRHDGSHILQVDPMDLPAAVQQLLRPGSEQGDADRPPAERVAERQFGGRA